MSADFTELNHAGLNLQAVFDLDALPAALRPQIDPAAAYRQLILIGHGGRRLWQQLQVRGPRSEHPVDDFSIATVSSWFATRLPTARFAIPYPGDAPIGLQSLGERAGWHHDTPFRLGINAVWGTWFAYRVAVLADTRLPITAPMTGDNPCARCFGQPCVVVCPAGALAGADFSLALCIAYRTQPNSRCALTCIARTCCPVRPEHRYEEAQMAHSYARSLATLMDAGRHRRSSAS